MKIAVSERLPRFNRVFSCFMQMRSASALFEPEQLAEIYRALAFVREQDETLSCGRDQELKELMEQVGGLLPPNVPRQRDAPEQSGMTMK